MAKNYDLVHPQYAEKYEGWLKARDAYLGGDYVRNPQRIINTFNKVYIKHIDLPIYGPDSDLPIDYKSGVDRITHTIEAKALPHLREE